MIVHVAEQEMTIAEKWIVMIATRHAVILTLQDYALPVIAAEPEPEIAE